MDSNSDLPPDPDQTVNVIINGEEFDAFRQQMITAYGFLQMFSSEELPPFDEWLALVVEQAVTEAAEIDPESPEPA